MTESSSDVEYSTNPAPKPASLWEDFIDIFSAPRSVFERRENSSPWPAILVVSAILLIISFATFNSIAPAIENEMRTQMAKSGRMTEDAINQAVGMTMKFARFGGLVLLILIPLTGLWYWLVGYPFSNKQRTIASAMMAVGYAYIIRCVSGLVSGIQALLMDPLSLTSPFAVSASAARFVDRDSVSPVVWALSTKIDLFDFWYITLLAIGLTVIGRTSRGKAIAFGIVYWALGAGWAVLNAMRSSAAGG